MAKLEAIYLCNVLLYIDKKASLIKFLFISKKCKTAVEIIRINPYMTYFNFPFLLSYFNGIQSIRGNLIEFQNEIDEKILNRICWFEIDVISSIGLLKKDLLNRIIEIKIEANDIIRLYLLVNVQKVVIYHFHGKLLSFDSVIVRNKLKRITIYHEEEMNDYEIKSLIALCQRFENVSVKITTSTPSLIFPLLTNLQVFNFYNSNEEVNEAKPIDLNEWFETENEPINIVKQIEIFDENSLWEISDVGMNQLNLIINKNTLDFLDLSCFEFLANFQLTISSGRHLNLMLPIGIISLTLNGNSLWVANLKELLNLKTMIIKSNYGPFTEKQTKPIQKKICLPNSVTCCFIKSFNPHSRFGSLAELNNIKQLNLSGVIDSLDCSQNDNLTCLIINSYAPLLTVTFNTHLNYICLTNKKGGLSLKNSNVLKNLNYLSLDGDFEEMDISQIVSVQDLILNSTSKKTTIRFPRYDQQQLQHYFDFVNLQPKPKSSILCCKSLSLKGNFLISKLFLGLTQLSFPTIECSQLKNLIIHYHNVECIGYDHISRKLKVISPINKCCSCIPIVSNISQFENIKISVLYKTKVFVVSSPKTLQKPSRPKSRSQRQRMFGSKSPNKGVNMHSEDSGDNSSDLDEENKQYLFHSDI